MRKLKIAEAFSTLHSLEIIFICENNGNVTQLARKLGLNSTTSVYTVLEKLEKFGLIDINVITEKGYRRIINLSEKGKKILEKLKEIELLL